MSPSEVIQVWEPRLLERFPTSKIDSATEAAAAADDGAGGARGGAGEDESDQRPRGRAGVAVDAARRRGMGRRQ